MFVIKHIGHISSMAFPSYISNSHLSCYYIYTYIFFLTLKEYKQANYRGAWIYPYIINNFKLSMGNINK
jgi:hypothetical protein